VAVRYGADFAVESILDAQYAGVGILGFHESGAFQRHRAERVEAVRGVVIGDITGFLDLRLAKCGLRRA
jgi:hypothetical protein